MAGFRAIRSFVVRALLERSEDDSPSNWRGQISDVETGERQGWTETHEIGQFVEDRLALHADDTDSDADHSIATPFNDSASRPLLRAANSAMALATAESVPLAAPALNDVLSDLLDELALRLPTIVPPPPFPEPNVTFETVKEKLVGIGGFRGTEALSPIGPQALKGGRIEGRVRFQLWGAAPTDVDDAIVSLQGTILADSEPLRADGFLKIVAAETSLAEHVPTLNGWRKTTSYDVLYEFQYRDSDDALSLIARIPIDTDLNFTNSPDRESETVTDEMVRWDREGAATLFVNGPSSIATVDVLAFIPGPPIGGTVTVLRTTVNAVGLPAAHPDITAFLDAVSGTEPLETHAETTGPLAAFLAGFNAHGVPIELGDWDVDLVPDTYDGFHLAIAPPISLTQPGDQFHISYRDPGGVPPGLVPPGVFDPQAVLYIRVNAP